MDPRSAEVVMMDQGRISVIIPVFNGARFIVEAVASALAQGRCVGEVLVVDDGSTDGTAEIVAAMGEPRVRIAANPGAGVSAARNHGVSIAGHGWIGFLDADDRLKPDAYRRLRAAATSGAVVVYGDYDRIDASGRRVGLRHLMRRRGKPSGDVLDAVLCRNFIPIGAALIRRGAFAAISGFDTNVRLCEDWLLWCRLATQGPFVYCPDLHVCDYRIHRDSTMHREALPFATMAPVIDVIFTDPLVVAARSDAALTAFRQQAEASLHTYIATEAIRLRDWRLAKDELSSFAHRSPAGIPRMTLKVAASMAGL